MGQKFTEVDGIDFGDGYTLIRVGQTLRFERRGVTLFEFGTAAATAYTQTFATADRTHETDGSAAAAAATATAIAAAAASAAAAATATAIAAAIPAAAPAGGTGATAGAYDTAANRDSAITTINDLRTWAIEVDLDYEAILVDVADIRSKFNTAVTHTTEIDLDYEAILVDVADIRTQFNLLRTTVADVKQLVNSVIDDLQARSLLG